MNSIVPKIRATPPDARPSYISAPANEGAAAAGPVTPGKARQLLHQGTTWQVNALTLKPGQHLAPQRHGDMSGHWMVVAGEAHITLEDDVMMLEADEAIYIPAGTLHRLENRSTAKTTLIEVCNTL